MFGHVRHPGSLNVSAHMPPDRLFPWSLFSACPCWNKVNLLVRNVTLSSQIAMDSLLSSWSKPVGKQKNSILFIGCGWMFYQSLDIWPFVLKPHTYIIGSYDGHYYCATCSRFIHLYLASIRSASESYVFSSRHLCTALGSTSRINTFCSDYRVDNSFSPELCNKDRSFTPKDASWTGRSPIYRQ